MFSQSNENPENLQTQENVEIKEENKNPFSKPFLESTSFFAGFGPSLFYISDSNLSAPPPIVYPVFIGLAWPKDFFLSTQPSIKFFSNYYFVNEGKVLPAEVENRTAYGFSFFVNVPIVFTLNIKNVTNLKASVGLAFLCRFAILASNVEESDSGYYGSAKEDLKQINDSFYERGKFVYLSTSIDWMFNLKNNMQFGPELSFYIPIVTVFSEFNLQGTMINLSLKVIF